MLCNLFHIFSIQLIEMPLLFVLKKPYIDWANEMYPKNRPITSRAENNIYLVHEKDSNEDVLKWVKRNFNKIFENELNDWCTDEESWPKKRSYKMFSEWFDLEISSMVLDLEEDPIDKD